MDNYYVIKKNGKYAIMKEGGKRAVKLFQSEQEALDYISLKGNMSEVDITNLFNHEASGETTTTVDFAVNQPGCCTDNCKCKKQSLLSRILNFFKKS